MSTIEHEYTLNSITALAFYQPPGGSTLVLVGEGAFLKIYEPSTLKLLSLCRIFDSQTVHGVFVKHGGLADDDFRVAIWGGRSFTILRTTQIDRVIRGQVQNIVEAAETAPDWILDGAISPSSTLPCCVFITAHCATLQVSSVEGSQDLDIRSLSAPSQSILYSAHVLWASPSSIIVAAGTVFGEVEVFIWEITKDEPPKSHHLYTFVGHEGSVFGVKISPEIIFPDGGLGRILSSCSDDRTIRAWDLSLPPIENGFPVAQSETSPLIRETGFGDNPEVLRNDLRVTRCIAVVMAHSSRIWRVDFFIPPGSGSSQVPEIHILSFGEDATCQQWSLDWLQTGNNLRSPNSQDLKGLGTLSVQAYPANLKHIHTSRYHSGKHIWSAILCVDGSQTRLLTGGSDGKISFFSVFAKSTHGSAGKRIYNTFENEFSDMMQSSSSAAGTRLLNESELAKMRRLEKSPKSPDRTDGSINGKLSTFSSLNFLPRLDDPGTGQVAKTKTKPGKQERDTPNRYAFVAAEDLLISTSSGRLVLVSIGPQPIWQELCFADKIHHDLKSYSLLLGIPTHGAGILAGSNGVLYAYNSKRILMEIMKLRGKPAALFNVTRPAEKQIRILATTIGSNEANLLHVSLSQSQDLILQESLIVSLAPSFVVTSAAYVQDLLVVGARNGSLATYHLASSANALGFRAGREAHTDDAITAIVVISPSDHLNNNCHFITTCRNGSYSIFSMVVAQRLDISIQIVSLTLVHQCYPPFGPMIEAAWFEGSDLLLYGFRGKSFVVWNETKGCKVTSVECGGAHRSYAYYPIPGKGGAGYLAYTKASKVYLNTQDQPSHVTLKPGGHGREIKACADNGTLIATGAEDTMIRIWNYRCSVDNARFGALKCCAVIEKHTTGIQHLQWGSSADGHHTLFSAGGSEEFYVWGISHIPGFGIGVICEATLLEKSEDGDLRIMGFDVEDLSDSNPLNCESRPPDLQYRVTLIHSDSTIKIYSYSKSRSFQKVAHCTYTTACLKQLVSLRNPRCHKFFTAATDGYLTLWSHSNQTTVLPPNPLCDIPQPQLNTSENKVLKLAPVSRRKLHQSSIMAMEVFHLTRCHHRNDNFLVATAGDDNALTITLYQELQPTQCIRVPSAHAAGITGVAFKKLASKSDYPLTYVQLFTIGVDQRLKKWTIKLEADVECGTKAGTQAAKELQFDLSQAKGDDVWTSVADPAGLVLWQYPGDGVGEGVSQSRALVFGNGVEIFGLSGVGGAQG